MLFLKIDNKLTLLNQRDLGNWNTENLISHVSKKYNLPTNDFYLIANGRLLKYDQSFEELIDTDSIIEVRFRLRGGLFGGGGNPFSAIIKPIKDMAMGIIKIGKFFVALPKLILWLIDFIIWLVTDFINPFVWIPELIKGIFLGVKIVMMEILDSIMGLVRYWFNIIFEPIVGGFWGEPSDLPKGDKPCREGKKCIKQPPGKVPLPVLFGTIVLPPLGVFMELGLSGWLNIFICALLTLAFYFPGLIYALIILYC